jgi:hypothetical protein
MPANDPPPSFPARGVSTVRLSLNEGVFLRSSTWARLQLGIPLPVERVMRAHQRYTLVFTASSPPRSRA